MSYMVIISNMSDPYLRSLEHSTGEADYPVVKCRVCGAELDEDTVVTGCCDESDLVDKE